MDPEFPDKRLDIRKEIDVGDKVELLLIGPQTLLPVSVTADDLTLRKVCLHSLDRSLLEIKVEILREGISRLTFRVLRMRL